MTIDAGLRELEAAIEHVHRVGRGMGLDPWPIHYEVVPATILYEFGAYVIPGRFSHWTHGKAYHQLKSSYDYGLSKIYELVINSDPAYAFLLDTNSLLHNKFVAAHVFAHVDFFKHNAYFAPTSKSMPETSNLNADRIRAYEFEHGADVVEKFLDQALAIADHVDPTYRRPERPAREKARDNPDGRGVRRAAPGGTPYHDLFPPEPEPGDGKPPHRRFPPDPVEDLPQFLIDFAPDLEDWQRDVLAIVRQEALYLRPQGLTKIMNEGWASFWHLRIMRELPLGDAEFTEFAKMHAAVVVPSPTRINPYYLGLKVWEDLEKRLGRDRLFEIREVEGDASFIRNHLTEDLCEELDLYAFALDDDEWKVTETDWEKVRDRLAASLLDAGVPHIVVHDADHRRNRELFLRHLHDGRELDVNYAEKTLVYVENLWGRPVHLETVVHGRKVVVSCDGGNVLKTMH